MNEEKIREAYERGKLKSLLSEVMEALEEANGLYFSTYTTVSKSPYDILIKKIEDML